MGDDHEHLSLVVPFLAVQSVGGPYEDSAFAAGCQYGELRGVLLEAKPATHVAVILAPLREQADLLAMEAGYGVTFEDWGEGWLRATFVTLAPTTQGAEGT